jgi:hypothetical protein
VVVALEQSGVRAGEGSHSRPVSRGFWLRAPGRLSVPRVLRYGGVSCAREYGESDI